MATGVMKGGLSAGALSSSKSERPPFPSFEIAPEEVISLRSLKSLAKNMRPDHPLRIVLLGEPDEMSRSEYGSKLMSWIRLAHCAKE
jgi:hypothetical protein